MDYDQNFLKDEVELKRAGSTAQNTAPETLKTSILQPPSLTHKRLSLCKMYYFRSPFGKLKGPASGTLISLHRPRPDLLSLVHSAPNRPWAFPAAFAQRAPLLGSWHG